MHVRSTALKQPPAARHRVAEVLEPLMQIDVALNVGDFGVTVQLAHQNFLGCGPKFRQLMQAREDERAEGVGLLRLDAIPSIG